MWLETLEGNLINTRYVLSIELEERRNECLLLAVLHNNNYVYLAAGCEGEIRDKFKLIKGMLGVQ